MKKLRILLSASWYSCVLVALGVLEAMSWNRCWAGSPVKNLLGTLSRSVIKYNLVVNREISSNQFTVYVNLLIIQLLISKSFSLNWMVLNTAVTVYLSIGLNSEYSQILNATEKSKTPFDFFSLILHICIMDWFVSNNYWLPFVHILFRVFKENMHNYKFQNLFGVHPIRILTYTSFKCSCRQQNNSLP